MLSFFNYHAKILKNPYKERSRKISDEGVSSHKPPPVFYKIATRKKRVPDPTCLVSGSITVEAAVAVPLFLAAIVVLIYLLQAIHMQVLFRKALYNQVMNAVSVSYYGDTIGLDLNNLAGAVVTDEVIKAGVIGELGEDYLDNSLIVGGSSGIYINLTNGYADGMIDVALEYQMQPPFDLLGVGRLTLITRVRCRSWTGIREDDKEESEVTLVYVTENGSVYHKDRNCTYIKVTYDSCSGSEIGSKRNDSGAKYYPCEYCCRDGGSYSTVYYMSYGTRYHSTTTDCPNFKRSVYAIDLESAKEKYRACSKCGGDE